jgi:hypothetical protein
MPKSGVLGLAACLMAVIIGGSAFADVVDLQEIGRLTSKYTPYGAANQITFLGNYMYYSLDAGGFEIRDRYTLQLLSTTRASSAAYTVGFALDGDYAYLADWGAGLTVLDINNKSKPVVVGQWDKLEGNCFAYDVLKVGNRLFLTASGKGLYTIDVTDPCHPADVALYPLSSIPDDILQPNQSNRLFVSAYDKLYTFDITDPDNVRRIQDNRTYPNYTATYNPARKMVITSFQNAPNNVLRIFDATDVDHLTLLTTYALPAPPGQIWHQVKGVACFENYIMYTESTAGVTFLDATDIYHPQEVAYFAEPADIDKFGNTIAIDGQTAYVGTGHGGIIMLDLSYYIPVCCTRIVPEPATVLLAVPALAGLACIVRKRGVFARGKK